MFESIKSRMIVRKMQVALLALAKQYSFQNEAVVRIQAVFELNKKDFIIWCKCYLEQKQGRPIKFIMSQRSIIQEILRKVQGQLKLSCVARTQLDEYIKQAGVILEAILGEEREKAEGVVDLDDV